MGEVRKTTFQFYKVRLQRAKLDLTGKGGPFQFYISTIIISARLQYGWGNLISILYKYDY